MFTRGNVTDTRADAVCLGLHAENPLSSLRPYADVMDSKKTQAESSSRCSLHENCCSSNSTESRLVAFLFRPEFQDGVELDSMQQKIDKVALSFKKDCDVFIRKSVNFSGSQDRAVHWAVILCTSTKESHASWVHRFSTFSNSMPTVSHCKWHICSVGNEVPVLEEWQKDELMVDLEDVRKLFTPDAKGMEQIYNNFEDLLNRG
jgi:hypothetical protein